MTVRGWGMLVAIATLSCACTGQTAATSSTPATKPAPAISADGSTASEGVLDTAMPDAGGNVQDASISPGSIGATSADAGIDPATRLEVLGIQLFDDDPDWRKACPAGANDRESCLFSKRFAHDAESAKIARELWEGFGVAAGVAPAHVIDGGFRGMIKLVPAPPEGADRKHLAWILDSYKDMAAFFGALAASAKKKIPYRVNDVKFRFMRSVGRTTPSAYADDWTISYNVQGSLLKSEPSVRETIFHEIFHLNDQQHGDWSPGALSSIYDPIVKKCGTTTACLTPYAPNDTQVRGGTYYAFTQNNGVPVHEYAAELSVRYFKEHRAIIRGETPLKPWKCINAENAKAWALLRDEFFAGADLTAACP